MLPFRHVVASTVAVAVAAGLSCFAIMDANPSLYVYDKLVAITKQRRKLLEHPPLLAGRTMWLIGASSGIGASLAQLLAANGVTLVLSARNVDNLHHVANKCRACHPQQDTPLVVPLDVCWPQERLESTVDRVLLETTTPDDCCLDCVIFNAGIGQQSPAIDTSPETCARLFQVNALGIMNIATLILQKSGSHWMAKEKGHFVVTSSVAAKTGIPLSAAYAASKHAIHGYMRSLQAELPWLKMTLPCPGPIATDFHNDDTTVVRRQAPSAPNLKKEMKMPVDRCARLILSSILMTKSSSTRTTVAVETWVAQQPTLFFMYLSQYAPALAQRILNKVGPMRIGMWREGLNIYDPNNMRRYRQRKKQLKNKVGDDDPT